MLLAKVLPNIKKKYKHISFKNIKFNSKDCKTNDIFFAISGNYTKGNKYINDAINNGAKIIISNLKFNGFNKYLSEYARRFDTYNCLHNMHLSYINLRRVLTNIPASEKARKSFEGFSRISLSRKNKQVKRAVAHQPADPASPAEFCSN